MRSKIICVDKEFAEWLIKNHEKISKLLRKKYGRNLNLTVTDFTKFLKDVLNTIDVECYIKKAKFKKKGKKTVVYTSFAF
ncbi:MAG: hypothetical protein RMJ67_06620 [Elusimicrobiota bacterium]|nr:hypothetical protein [Endomicrobiia bacterium]MDW8166167.1 hypothetical protein [Elusimicrobiota bacterium]